MRLAVLNLAACVLALTACGSSSDRGASSAPPVRVAISTPRDLAGVRDASVDVRGTVRPAAATVLVHGVRADVSPGGAFSAPVALEPGVNVIDVLASAGARRPALTAVRVRRLTTVLVPDVTGFVAADATSALHDAGLQVDVHRRGGLFDRLFGGDPVVCSTTPAAGDRAEIGSTVQVEVSGGC